MHVRRIWITDGHMSVVENFGFYCNLNFLRQILALIAHFRNHICGMVIISEFTVKCFRLETLVRLKSYWKEKVRDIIETTDIRQLTEFRLNLGVRVLFLISEWIQKYPNEKHFRCLATWIFFSWNDTSWHLESSKGWVAYSSGHTPVFPQVRHRFENWFSFFQNFRKRLIRSAGEEMGPVFLVFDKWHAISDITMSKASWCKLENDVDFLTIITHVRLFHSSTSLHADKKGNRTRPHTGYIFTNKIQN